MLSDSMLKDKVFKVIGRKREEIIDFLQRLVSIKSVTRNEEIAQNFMKKKFEEMNLLVRLVEAEVDKVENHPAYVETSWVEEAKEKSHIPNLVGILDGKGGGKSLILNGHVDVVSPEPVDLWTHDPWGGEIDDGKLYGRGAWDMKAGIVAMIFAVQCIQEIGIRLKGDVLLESVVEEECGGAYGTLTLILSGYKGDAVIIPEPTNFGLCVAGGGLSYFRVRVKGKTAHPSKAHTGVNAVGKIMKIYKALEELDMYRRNKVNYPLFERWYGESCNLHIGTLRAGDWPPTVAGWAVMEGRVSFVPGEEMEDVRTIVEETVNKAASLDPWMRDNPPEIEWFGWKADPYEQGPDHPLFQIIRRVSKDDFGIEIENIGIPGGLDTRFFVRYADIPAVCLGPRGGNDHGIDEYVVLEDVLKLTKMLSLILMKWCRY